MQVCAQVMFRVGLATLALSLACTAEAKDKPEPVAPCPLDAKLRVAEPGSLSGIRSLDSCAGQIIFAPALPSDFVEPRTIRVAPPEERERPSMAATQRYASDGTMVKIAPMAQEPQSPEFTQSAALTRDDVGTSASGEAILAMTPVSYRTPYDEMITRVARRHRIDPLFLHAVIDQESRYHAGATSRVGARGLMQLMPATARGLGANASVPESNVDGGARMLRRLHGRYNDFSLTLAAYNAGEGAVQKYGNQIPPYAETQNYVKSVMARYRKLVAEQPQIAAR
jgi:soluble lytic murein transglycosylase-like protein